MIELVLVYCMNTDPATCVEKRDALSDFPSPMECMEEAQTRALEYVAGHPQWRLSRWRCEVDVPRQDPT